MSDESSKYELPDGWAWTKIGDICLTSSGGTPNRKKTSYYKGDIPWVKSGELNYNTIHDTEEHITSEAIENSSAKLVPKDSLLIALYGATVGRLAFLGIEAATNQAVAALRTFGKFSNRYLYYFLYHNKEEILAKRVGGAQPNISQAILNGIEIPIPPLKEQNRIVEKIEELFSGLDHSVENLKVAQKQLTTLKHTLQKHAFEGKLTEEWRKENSPDSGRKLMEQIKEQRKTQYEQELKAWKKKLTNWKNNKEEGKKPRKPKAPVEVSNLTNDELAILPRIPESWLWSKLGAVCLKIMDGTHFSPKNSANGKYMYITAKNIQEGRIDLKDVTYVSEEDHRDIYSRCDVQKGDVLYIKDGATTGRSAVNYIDEEFSLLSSVGVFRTPKNLLIPKFLEYYLNSEVTRKRMLSKTAGVAITRLTLVKLNNSAVCLCSTHEQKKILEILESEFSIIHNLEIAISSSLQKSEALRQSILKKAFEGKLANQDFNDEPAGILLDKIKKEKEALLKAEKERKILETLRIKKRREMTEKLKSIMDILKERGEPILAKTLWEESLYKDDIDEFYAALKIHLEAGEIIELPRQGKESYLKLVDSK